MGIDLTDVGQIERNCSTVYITELIETYEETEASYQKNNQNDEEQPQEGCQYRSTNVGEQAPRAALISFMQNVPTELLK